MKSCFKKITWIWKWAALSPGLLAAITAVPAKAAETVDVTISKGKISARSTNLRDGDLLNICNRDSAYHQPYSVSPPNKFGSSKAKDKDLLSKGQCRLVQLKNTGTHEITMTINDRLMPAEYLVVKILPPLPGVAETPAAKDSEPTFPNPMQGKNRLAYCYSPDDGCGEKAANTWCVNRGYKGAKKWEMEARDMGKSKTTRYIGSDQSCKPGACDAFASITCRTGPPTFF